MLRKIISGQLSFFISCTCFDLFAEKIPLGDESLVNNDTVEEQEEDANGKSSDSPCGELREWLEPDDDELIVIETGDGAPLVGTLEAAESYYVVNPNQHSFSGLSPSGIFVKCGGNGPGWITEVFDIY